MFLAMIVAFCLTVGIAMVADGLVAPGAVMIVLGALVAFALGCSVVYDWMMDSYGRPIRTARARRKAGR